MSARWRPRPFAWLVAHLRAPFSDGAGPCYVARNDPYALTTAGEAVSEWSDVEH